MSKRAEEAASKAYPLDKPHLICKDCQRILQEVYQEGYEQAEKDLSLTWEEIKRIHEIANDVWDEYVDDSLAELELEPMKEQEYYEKILNRFNNERK